MKYCGQCGCPAEDQAKFCMSCGTAFAQPTPETTPIPAEQTPETTPIPVEHAPEAAPFPAEQTPDTTPIPAEQAPETTPFPAEPTSEAAPFSAEQAQSQVWMTPGASDDVSGYAPNPWQEPPKKKKKLWPWIVGGVVTAALALLVAVYFLLFSIPQTPEARLGLALSRCGQDLSEFGSMNTLLRPVQIENKMKANMEFSSEDLSMKMELITDVQNHRVYASGTPKDSESIEVSLEEATLLMKMPGDEAHVYLIDLAEISPELAESLWKNQTNDANILEHLTIVETEETRGEAVYRKFAVSMDEEWLSELAPNMTDVELPTVYVYTDKRCNLKFISIELDGEELTLNLLGTDNPWEQFAIAYQDELLMGTVQNQNGVMEITLVDRQKEAVKLTWDDANGRLIVGDEDTVVTLEYRYLSKEEISILLNVQSEGEEVFEGTLDIEATDEEVQILEGQIIDITSYYTGY